MLLTTFPYTENYAENTYTFRVTAPCCGAVKELTVRGADLFRYNRGARLQDAFPYLPAADREILISGTCGECWEKMFPAAEDA